MKLSNWDRRTVFELIYASRAGAIAVWIKLDNELDVRDLGLRQGLKRQQDPLKIRQPTVIIFGGVIGVQDVGVVIDHAAQRHGRQNQRRQRRAHGPPQHPRKPEKSRNESRSLPPPPKCEGQDG